MPLVIPISIVRNAWKQIIVPIAMAEPMVLCMILTTVARGLQALRGMPLAECHTLLYSNRLTAMRLLNQKLDKIHGAPNSTIEAAIAVVLSFVGQEV